MAKKLTVSEAVQKVIDKVNLLSDTDSVNIDAYMSKYSSLRALEGKDYENAYETIASALFGGYSDKEPSGPVKVGYRLESYNNLVATIYVEDIGPEVGMHSFSGWGVQDAIRKANKRLRLFGYEIAD